MRFAGQSLYNPREHANWKLLPAKCGGSSSERIIGGKEADIGTYPWMARIGYKSKLDLVVIYYSEECI